MNPNSELYFNIPQGVKSLVHINVVTGKALIGYENDEQSKQEISGKYSSMYLQSTENNLNRIKIKTEKDSNFVFYTYLKIGSIKRNINEISLGSAILRTGEGFPIEFYSKVYENQDYVINFNLNNFNFKEIEEQNYDISIFNFRAYIVTEDIIEKLKLDDTYVYNKNSIKGKYEIGFSMAKLVLNKEFINQYISKDKNNYIYLVIEDSYSNPTILNNIYGEITILQNNNINYVSPNNIYINSNLEAGINSVNKYKLIKKNSDDKIMRIEFSPSSQNIEYKLYYDNSTDLLKTSKIEYGEKSSFGKKNIDINLEKDFDSIIFEVYNENKENDINKLSYSLRYRTGKENIFKNYITDDEIKIIQQKKEDKIRSISLNIPILKDNETETKISAEYYLKIYKFSEKDLFINNTISIIDNLDPYKIIEFTINDTNYTQNIEIPNDNNKYYVVINAITNERELLSYNSFIIDIDEQEGEKSEGLPIWAIILIIIGILILIIVIILIIRYARKNKINDIEKNNETMIPLSSEKEENNLNIIA